MDLSAGTRLGPYKIVALIGAGGMGDVYKASDTRLERDVAVMVLTAHLTESPQARERFQREARAVAALPHPNIWAAAEFQKIVDHKGANWGATWIHPYWGQFYSLSYLGMARGSALAGDTAKAKKAFRDFLELWKDADSDIPILQQAKAEYAKLQ